MSFIKDGLAKAWADSLWASTGLEFFPYRHDGFTEPPFGVVVVRRLEPILPLERVYVAELRIVVVSDAADTLCATQSERSGIVEESIRAIPSDAVSEIDGVRLCGFMLDEIGHAEAMSDAGGKIFSDVFSITAGVCAYDAAAVDTPE